MKRIVLVVFFLMIILKSYAAPSITDGEVIGLFLGGVMVFISGILFINSILQRFLLDYKSYYKKVFWHSLLVVLSLIILKFSSQSDRSLITYFYIIGFILLVCLINLLIGNRSLYSSSEKDQQKNGDEGDMI